MSICDHQKPQQDNNEILDLPDGVPPLRAFYLYLSSSCNLACRHCWITPRFVAGQPDPGEVINSEALQTAIEEAIPLGLNSIKLTGGEPLLHPNFREICDLATEKELMMTMETNGTLLTADMARYLKNETTLEYLSVSIDSAHAAGHDTFRGVKGAFDSVLRGLDHLVAAGFENVQVIMSVHRGNRDEIEDVARLAASHGAASVKLSPVISSGRGAHLDKRGETLNFAEHLALDNYLFKELKPRLQTEELHIDLVFNLPPALTPISKIMHCQGDTGDCGVQGILGFLGSGEIVLCGIGRNTPELVYGRLGKDSIRAIWFGHPTLLKLRQALDDVENYPGICGKCTMARLCRTGCVAQNFAGGRQLVWPNVHCQEAYQRGLFPVTRQKYALRSIPLEATFSA